MSVIQSISCPSRGIILTAPNARHVRTSVSRISYLKTSCLHVSLSCPRLYPRLSNNALKNKRCVPVHALVNNGDSNSGPSPLESPKKPTELSDLTVQDVLREQMKGTQFGGSGGKGNSSGSGGDGSGGSGGEGFKRQIDEFLQVIMAAIGVIFLYTLITSGEQLVLLARDYMRYLLGAKPSSRLERTLEKWHKIYRSITGKGVASEGWM